MLAPAATYQFVFAQGPETGSLWIRDPPGGKSAATTDPNWASTSVNYLNNLVSTQGPFYGILGYSQGSAMATYYLSVVATGTFQKAFLFCGYLPETHTGLMNSINSASPFSNVPALVFMGVNDFTITNSMTNAQAAKFTSPTVVTSSSAGHHLPYSSDATYSTVLASFPT
eukprot:1939406-Prymnesium_polylepis.1